MVFKGVGVGWIHYFTMSDLQGVTEVTAKAVRQIGGWRYTITFAGTSGREPVIGSCLSSAFEDGSFWPGAFMCGGSHALVPNDTVVPTTSREIRDIMEGVPAWGTSGHQVHARINAVAQAMHAKGLTGMDFTTLSGVADELSHFVDRQVADAQKKERDASMEAARQFVGTQQGMQTPVLHAKMAENMELHKENAKLGVENTALTAQNAAMMAEGTGLFQRNHLLEVEVMGLKTQLAQYERVAEQMGWIRAAAQAPAQITYPDGSLPGPC